MAKKKIRKTNAMRRLDQLKQEYSTSTYSTDGGIDALHVAESLGVPAARIFKTIVLEADGGSTLSGSRSGGNTLSGSRSGGNTLSGSRSGSNGSLDGVKKEAFITAPSSYASAGHSSYAPAGGKAHFVAVIGAEHDLDLKKVAAHFGVKSVKLFNWKELKALTGYVRGGCSPIGMKRQFPTVIDSSAEGLDSIYVSAGEIGTQIILAPAVLAEVTAADFANIRQSVHH